MPWTLDPETDSPSLTAVGEQTNPFLSNRFLRLLKQSGSGQQRTGWEAKFAHHSDGLTMPVYRKAHSYGEYVFDWSWANAYAHAGLEYYPKLLTAIPFTPSIGPRILGAWNPAHIDQWVDALPDLCSRTGTSGWHLLFPEKHLLAHFTEPEFILRKGCQFHWYNREYRDFDDFLDRMTARKRKNLRKERRRVAEQGIEVRMVEGIDMTWPWLQEFYLFYQDTYLKRSQTGYLTELFFRGLLSDMAKDVCFALAFKGDTLIAGALFFKDQHTLYGRYWGARTDVDCLHFEACYYQGIEYAITHGLQRFDPGTQGEHKIARGFEPTATWSAHWLNHRGFHEAIRQHLRPERAHIDEYMTAA
ncbi:MAG: GNAT family N-acetyltransferase, partial [Natronospirillum sp.]